MPADPASRFVYLASASPRRRELLGQIGVAWQAAAAQVDESRREGEAPADYVSRLALAKARDAAARLISPPRYPVLSADTAVAIGDQVLGKPANAADCRRMLRLLSGSLHAVFSAVAVISAVGESVAVNHTEVVFRDITDAEIGAYWRSGEPADKAGGYGIQGLGAVFVQEIRGSYSCVMGLPLFETAVLLAEHGMPVLSP